MQAGSTERVGVPYLAHRWAKRFQPQDAPHVGRQRLTALRLSAGRGFESSDARRREADIGRERQAE